ncbi:MAG: YceI family protein [Crocinitomicaceae bacterium]|nr:YceI family protein [Crocinitomicaceae bacterium]
MKKGIFFFAVAITVGTLSSCKGDSPVEDAPVEETKICYYSYEHGTSFLEWTGYKTSANVGVSGSFNDFEVTGGESSDDPKEVIESLSFVIQTASVETKLEARNKKLAENFFGSMTSTEEITGNVKSLNEDGKAILSITMNEVTVDVEGVYKLSEGKFEFSTTINMEAWNAIGAIDALSEVCKEQHTGDDGILRTSSEVALVFSTQLSSDC